MVISSADDRFSEFWMAYPRKVAKQAALKAWQKLKPDANTCTAIMTALQAATNSEAWRRDGGRFIPHAATWLNGKRWEDEASPGADARLRVAI